MTPSTGGPAESGRLPPYLAQVPLEEARHRWYRALAEAGGGGLMASESIPVAGASGRVLAAAAIARFSSPSYHACAMDGYAVSAVDTGGATATRPVRLRLGQQAVYVDTGDPLPAACDAVIMIEDVESPSADEIEIRAAASPWQHVRPVGEDIAAGEMLLPAGWQLRGPDLAVLAAAGLSEVPVRRRPLVVIIPTGDEIVTLETLCGASPQPGQVIESNSLLAAGVACEAGAEALTVPVVPDSEQLIADAVGQALARADVVVLSAGSSAGSADYSAAILDSLGEVVVHGVATRPGKPTILAVCSGKPVIGMPGYPVSAWLALDNFLRPLLARLLGVPAAERQELPVRLARRLPSPAGVREYLRVKLGRIGGVHVAAPLGRGAGVLTSLVRADALVEVPPEAEGYEAGAEVQASLLRPLAEIDQTVVAIGSHDMALDVLGDQYRRRYPGCSLSSANAGSLGGLQALGRGEAHIAGTHLLDETSGEYNLSYVRRMLPGRRVALVCLVLRQQGLLVRRGNPLGLTGVADLARPGVRCVNRQRGAGTRVLLDYLLGAAGIAPVQVAGYERELYTHLAVAAEVAAGGADAGLGIMAAAVAAGLDFVPIAEERYELAIPVESWEETLVQRLLEVAGGSEFKAAVASLGGYDTRPTGEVRWITPEE